MENNREYSMEIKTNKLSKEIGMWVLEVGCMIWNRGEGVNCNWEVIVGFVL